MNKNIQTILRDLYSMDPELKKFEKYLVPLLSRLVEAKPNLKLDQKFVENLRHQLTMRANELMEGAKPAESPAKVGWFSQFFAPLMGGTVALAALIIGLMVWNGNLVFVPKGPAVDGAMIRLAEKNAFGPLGQQPTAKTDLPTGGYTKTIKVPKKATSTKTEEAVAQESSDAVAMKVESAPAAESGAMVVAEAPMPVPTAMARPQSGGGGMGGGGIGISPGFDTKSMWIPYVYKYIYKGETVELSKATVPVYKRVYEKPDDSALVKLLSKSGFGLIDIARLRGLSLENVTLSQNSDQGYIVNIDFIGNSVSIQPKWNTWENPALACNGDTDCMNRAQIKLAEYPGDEALSQWTREFFANYDIDGSNYGSPVIQKFWEENPEAKIDVLPDEIYMSYPLLVDGQPVYDVSGAPFGLMVTANLRFKKISGVSNLILPLFESSEYEAEQDFAKVLEYAEGGPNPWRPEDEFKTLEVELGTPEEVLTSVWLPSKDPNQPSEQVFVPALKFPITKKPKEEPYFWQKAIIVPLAKELVERLNEPIGLPMPLTEQAK